MFLLAVSSAILGSSYGFDLNEREIRAWRKVQPAVVYLLDGQSVSGSAALIDRDGYFLAHKTALHSKTISAKLSNGDKIELKLIASDDPTQFVLLKAADWRDDTVQALTVADSDAGSKSLIAITPSGPVRAERANDTYGIVNPSRRFMPLNELRLENNAPSLGGALLFDLNGQLAGAINAALEMTPMQNMQKNRGQADNVGRGTGGGGLGGPGGFSKNNVQFGPGVMTTAYCISPKVLRRVIAGFLSESHVVKHPAIGLLCRDAVPMGALIDTVTPGSTAEKAGLLKGDIINSMNGQGVQTQIDFARIMTDEEIGNKIRMWITRNGLKMQITVEVGAGS